MQWVLILFPDGEHSGGFLFHKLSQAFLGKYFAFSLKSLPSGRFKTSLFQRGCSILHCHFSLSPWPFHQSYDLHYHLCMLSPNYVPINKASFDTCKMHVLKCLLELSPWICTGHSNAPSSDLNHLCPSPHWKWKQTQSIWCLSDILSW